MKNQRVFGWVSMALAAFLSVGWTWGKKDSPSEQAKVVPAPAASPAAAATAAAAENIVYTFASDDEVKAFATLWQQRQGIITRMAVLRAYWSEEQARLNEMDTQLTSTYKVDLKKRHVLSQERKALIELEPLPESTATQGAAPGAGSAAPASAAAGS